MRQREVARQSVVSRFPVGNGSGVRCGGRGGMGGSMNWR